MRKTPTIALGIAASLAIAGGAFAQGNTPSHTLDQSVSPSTAGTRSAPRPVTVRLNIVNNAAAGTTASRIEIFLARTVRLNTRGFATCSEDTLTNDGPDACPRGSRVGSGTAGAVVNPTGANPAPVSFTNTFYVAGRNRLNVNLISSDETINRTFPVRVGRGGGRYGQKLTIDIPADLQQPAPGIYSALTAIQTTLRGTTGRGSRRHGIFESTGCSGGSHAFQTRVTYAPNPNPPAVTTTTATDEARCRR